MKADPLDANTEDTLPLHSTEDFPHFTQNITHSKGAHLKHIWPFQRANPRKGDILLVIPEGWLKESMVNPQKHS